MTPNLEPGRDFCTTHLPPSFVILCLLVRTLSCWQTNKQTPLKTSNALRYALRRWIINQSWAYDGGHSSIFRQFAWFTQTQAETHTHEYRICAAQTLPCSHPLILQLQLLKLIWGLWHCVFSEICSIRQMHVHFRCCGYHRCHVRVPSCWEQTCDSHASMGK